MHLSGLFDIATRYEHVIWDWNGTLLDDVDCSHRTIVELLASHGKPPITLGQYRTVCRFPVMAYYQALGFDFTRHPFEEIARAWVRIYESHQEEARLYPGVPQLLVRLGASGTCSHILTAAHERDVERLTTNFQIRSLFASIHGLDNHHAQSKLDRGRELMLFLGQSPQQMLLVGDTDHDAEVALDLGIDCVLLDGGHQGGRDHGRLEAAFRKQGRTLRHFSRRATGED